MLLKQVSESRKKCIDSVSEISRLVQSQSSVGCMGETTLRQMELNLFLQIWPQISELKTNTNGLSGGSASWSRKKMIHADMFWSIELDIFL